MRYFGYGFAVQSPARKIGVYVVTVRKRYRFAFDRISRYVIRTISVTTFVNYSINGRGIFGGKNFISVRTFFYLATVAPTFKIVVVLFRSSRERNSILYRVCSRVVSHEFTAAELVTNIVYDRFPTCRYHRISVNRHGKIVVPRRQVISHARRGRLDHKIVFFYLLRRDRSAAVRFKRNGVDFSAAKRERIVCQFIAVFNDNIEYIVTYVDVGSSAENLARAVFFPVNAVSSTVGNF